MGRLIPWHGRWAGCRMRANQRRAPVSHRIPWIVLVVLLLQAVACAKDAGTEMPAAERRFGDVTEARVLGEASSGENWLVNGGRFSGEHFSPLSQITTGNVDQLGLAWYADVPSFGFALEPIVVDGVIYVTGSLNRVFAYDARSGEMLWQFDPEVRLDISLGNSYGGRLNRGVAVWEGRVYAGTAECKLIALDATSGTKLWESPVCDPREGIGAHIRSAPRVGGGLVFMGYSGTTAARGSLAAFDAETGREVWRFWTVPGDPAKGFEAPELERASATWAKGWTEMGGGAVWEGIRYDPVTESVFFGTAAPGPLSPKLRGPGDALFSNSILAVDARTGAYKWHYQAVPGDAWDYDAAPPLIVTDLDYAGKSRRVVMSAPKNGFFYVLDALTGELLAADPLVEVTWASHVDMETGRPVENPSARYYDSDDPSASVLVKPSPGGGHTWHPMSFNPLTGLVYVPMTDLAANFQALAPAEGEAGPTRASGWRFDFVPDAWEGEALPADSGKLRAWDPVKREARWTIDHPVPWNGGVLSTAGEVVFQGTAGGELRAYRADDGKLLWSRSTGSGILSPPVTYQQDGEQVVLAAAGIGGGNGVSIAPYISTLDAQGPSRLFAFKLGGKAEMPAIRDFTPVPRPPARTASREQIERGRALFEEIACAYCHGNKVFGVGRQMEAADSSRLPGAVPDLRYMAEQTHAEWHGIVLAGNRKHLGMPAHVDVLSVEDSEALQAFVIEQAWKLYEKAQSGS